MIHKLDIDMSGTIEIDDVTFRTYKSWADAEGISVETFLANEFQLISDEWYQAGFDININHRGVYE